MSDNLFAGQKVRLVPLSKADAARLAQWTQDSEYLRLLDAEIAKPVPVATMEKRIEEANQSSRGFLFGLSTLDRAELVGFVELDGILWNQGVAWIGLAIGRRDNWDQGYGTDAMRLIINYAFRELNLRRLQLTVFEYNQRALQVYRNLGFQHEGTFRKFLERDGKVYDMYLMGLLQEEWPG